MLATATLARVAPAAGQVGPPGVEPRDGTATFTDLTGPGTCSFPGEPPDNLHVGLSTPEFGTADLCGGYLEVTGPAGTVRVKVTDHCPRCAPGLIDVTRTAFARIADEAAGRAPVTYRLARNPPLAEAISLRVKAGSSRWWTQIQPLDHGNPIARFEALQDGAWRALVHTADNYWTAADPGLGDGPFTVRITDVFGQQVTIDQVELAPGVVQPTGARLYPPPSAAELPPDQATTTTRPAVLAPPLSLPPVESVAGSRRAGSRAAGDGRADPSSGTGPSNVWPVFLVLVSAAALARAVLHRRARPRAAR